MVLCAFCGEEIEQGTGFIYVKDDGRQYPYCSSKCKKNHVKLKRNPVHTRWSKRFKK